MCARTSRGSVHASNVPETPAPVLNERATREPSSRSPMGEPLPGFADSEIAALLDPLRDAKGIVLAVSGGPDSLALLLMAWRWRAIVAAPPITVASVDHALRPESAAEIKAVAAQSARFGLVHRALRWEGPKPVTGVHEAARAARYRLLEIAARDAGATHLVTAHHEDDQAETVLLRLVRGSGVGGLAAMRRESRMASGLILARPLLGLPKARLVALVDAMGLVAVDDPSNRDPRFARGALRIRADAQEGLGLTAARLALLARRAARADDAIEQAADRAALRCGLPEPAGAVAEIRLAPALFLEAEEVRLRLLRRAILQVAGVPAGAQELRLERLEALGEGLAEARARGATLKRTLGGMVIRLAADGNVSLTREGPRQRGQSRHV
ncbi:tRNA(Ile)-lysidine synthase [Chelatococcus asaccharovorans]|nr:tRNA(Ile)-lysidine synthase [Chelatococcus asaccharovorans]CAH1685691.1 tRNA(Ile)-lysidine synthase [Chelatococcus asaccharovorans]